ncbi:MAG: NUDIX hydrolase [Chitinivibrionales bacterium]|nr:NUDIX hydrolase [Chitinivibrionales bacterium]
MSNLPYEFEPKVMAWKQSLIDHGCVIRKIEPVHLFYRHNGELLFAVLALDAVDPEGRPLPSQVVVRGHACVIVPLLINEQTGLERFLMVRQRRSGNGALSLEFPAGMLDRDLERPAAVALKELREETGLTIGGEQLVLLHDKPLLTSAGLLDEGIYYYGCRITLADAAFRAFEGRIAGAADEGEHITAALCTRKEAEAQTHSSQVMLGFSLFEKCFGPTPAVASSR